MTTLDFNLIPEPLRAASAVIERVTPNHSVVRQVPALLAWRTHTGVRLPEHPLRTHVCASAYDHINDALDAQKVVELYVRFPQDDMVVSLAGMPEVLSPSAARALLRAWGVSAERSASPWRAPSDNAVYEAAPLFLLHEIDGGQDPVAIVSTRYEISHLEGNRLTVDVYLDAVAVATDMRGQGLAHLAVLEAARWLAMLTRSLQFEEDSHVALTQRLHASPQDAAALHLSETFVANYKYFTVTDELIEEAKSGDDSEGMQSDGANRNLASIYRHDGVEECLSDPVEVRSETKTASEKEQAVLDIAIAALVDGALDEDAVELGYATFDKRTGRCRVRAYHQDQISVVFCTEIDANPGVSVTNAAPAPWHAAATWFDLHEHAVWIEHYGPESDGRREHTFERVSVDNTGTPVWNHVRRVQLAKAIAA